MGQIMNDSFIPAPIALVKELANEALAKKHQEAKARFDEMVKLYNFHINRAITFDNESDARAYEQWEKSWFNRFKSIPCKDSRPLKTLEESAEYMVRSYSASVKRPRSPISRTAFYMMYIINPGEVIGNVVENASENWPLLWKLANIDEKAISHYFKINNENSEPLIYLCLDHATQIGLIP